MHREEAISRLMKYCAYQDRSHSEVRNKLLTLEIYGDTLESIMSELITEGFLNEERYAQSYVRGKFKNNKWGRNKIVQALKFKKVSTYCIRKGLEEIDEEEYRLVLKKILNKKLMNSSHEDKYQLFKKLSQFAISKGYEYEIVKQVIQEIFLEHQID